MNELARARLRLQRLERRVGRRPVPGRRYLHVPVASGSIDEANPAACLTNGLVDVTVDSSAGAQKYGILRFDGIASAGSDARGLLYVEACEYRDGGAGYGTYPLFLETAAGFEGYGLYVVPGGVYAITEPFTMTDLCWNTRSALTLGAQSVTMTFGDEFIIDMDNYVCLLQAKLPTAAESEVPF